MCLLGGAAVVVDVEGGEGGVGWHDRGHSYALRRIDLQVVVVRDPF